MKFSLRPAKEEQDLLAEIESRLTAMLSRVQAWRPFHPYHPTSSQALRIDTETAVRLEGPQRDRLLNDCFTLHEIRCLRVVEMFGPGILTDPRSWDLTTPEEDGATMYFQAVEIVQSLILSGTLPLIPMAGWSLPAPSSPPDAKVAPWYSRAGCMGSALYTSGLPEWRRRIESPDILDLDLLDECDFPQNFSSRVEVVDVEGRVVREFNTESSGFLIHLGAKRYAVFVECQGTVRPLLAQVSKLPAKLQRLLGKFQDATWRFSSPEWPCGEAWGLGRGIPLLEPKRRGPRRKPSRTPRLFAELHSPEAEGIESTAPQRA